MKTKNLKKKLTLNKKTIADFKMTDTRGIHGGFKDPRIPGSELQDPCVSDGCTPGCGTVTGDPCIDC